MDPTSVLESMVDHHCRNVGGSTEALDLAYELLAWLETGGFTPKLGDLNEEAHRRIVMMLISRVIEQNRS